MGRGPGHRCPGVEEGNGHLWKSCHPACRRVWFIESFKWYPKNRPTLFFSFWREYHHLGVCLKRGGKFRLPCYPWNYHDRQLP